MQKTVDENARPMRPSPNRDSHNSSRNPPPSMHTNLPNEINATTRRGFEAKELNSTLDSTLDSSLNSTFDSSLNSTLDSTHEKYVCGTFSKSEGKCEGFKFQRDRDS